MINKTRVNIYLLTLLIFLAGCAYIPELPVLKRVENNPLLVNRSKPIDFAAVEAHHFAEATEAVISRANRVLKSIYKVPDAKRTFENTMLPIDDIRNIIENVWSPAGLLGFTHADAEVRKAGLASSQQIEEYLNSIATNENLYKSVVAYSKTKEANALVGTKKKFLKDELNKFHRSGFGLGSEQRKQVRKTLDRLVQIGIEFDKNKNDALDTLFVTEKNMQGLPEAYKNSHRLSDGTYAIDLSYPSYRPFMKYSESDKARKVLRYKYLNRASDTNLSVLDSMIIYRNKLADILGYASYAAYRTEDRMAKNPETVWTFENDLRENLRQKALSDYAEMLDIKSRRTGTNATVIESWEYSYYDNQLLLNKYQVNEQEVSKYFELTNVINGLFTIYQQLFNIEFKKVEHPSVWHEDVTMYEVFDKPTGGLIGRFYLDLFPRPNKYSHAAAFSVTMGKQLPDGYQKPATALVCNFPRPTADQPSLLPHGDVETFFHEFGHLLHGVLTKSPLMTYAGTSVMRDFVEAPSQMLENWVWNKEALALFAKHYRTGEVIPDTLLDKMLAAKNLNSGTKALQQIYYGVLDFTLHDGFDPRDKSTTDITAELQNEITLYPYMEGTHMQAAFGHLNGYGASYYGYLWSLVYAEDMFSVFEKNGILNPETGLRYRKIILETGGTENPYNLVVRFLGREPDNKAFLKSLGL